MRLQSLFFRTSILLSALIFSCFLASRAAAQSNAQAANPSSFAQTPAVPAGITQAIDETQLVRLKGNVHPLARPEFDQGPVDDSTPVKKAVLLLQRGSEQEAILQQLLTGQQVKDSPNFHKWLAPQQFGAQFGPADGDIQAVTQWLTGHGFQDVKVGAGRTTIEFSGTVGQVRNAFHTEIHQFNVNGQIHLANASDPQIPAAISPVIANVLGLHNFRPKSLRHRVQNFGKRIVGKEVTYTCGPSGATVPCFGVAPADFAKIYSVPSAVGGNPAGQGVPIAIVQDSNINITDVQQYRTAFGLTGGALNVILNGPDPGVLDPTTVSGDEIEADLDVELSGGVAPGATIDLVVSETTNSLGISGVDLSAIYAIDNNIAPILSESFGACETATNVAAFYATLWEQAAAQGITVLVATGDTGSDVCDAFVSPQQDFSTTGLSISGIASTPFNVALGGTDFQNGSTPSTYWSSPGTATESALSYIPESTWNSSCAAGAASLTLNMVCTATIINNNTSNMSFADLAGAGGGQSAISTNTKPPWQNGITPTTDRRDIPDISLYSAINTSNNTFYIICEADVQGGPCDPATAAVTPIGGTSAAAPAFAGIMAMVVQQEGGEPKGRQGNANFVLYQLFNKNKANSSMVCPSDAAHVSTTTCIFYDVVTGNNSVACAGGTMNCSNTSGAANQYGVLVDPASTTTPAFAAVAGYDKATGLGSVNVTNLLKAWTSATFSADTPSFTSSPSGTIAHGANASFTVKVTSGGSGTPSGHVSLVATPASPGAPVGIDNDINGNALTLDSTGTVTFQTNLLPGGTNYPVVAQYGGDGTFAPGTSPAVNVTVSKENSTTTASLLTFDSTTGLFDLPAPNPVVYGTTPYIMKVDVTNSGGAACATTFPVPVPCPTGNVAETYDGGKPLNDFPNTQTGVASNIASLNGLGFLEDQPIDLPGGSHTIVAAYAGDNSYNASTSNTLSLTVNAAPTSTTVAASPASGVTTTTSVTLTATIATTSGGNGPTGSVTFSAGGSTLGTSQVVPANASNPNAAVPFPASGTATLTHTFATAGTFTVSASYTTGDTNYTGSASSGAGNATVTVSSGTTTQTTTTAVTSSSTSLPAGGGSVTLTATVTGTGSGASPTGMVQFMNGSTALGTAQTCTAVSGASSPTCKATLTTTLSFLVPPAGPDRIPTIRVPWILLIGFALLILLLLNLKRAPARYRGLCATASFLLLAGLVVGLAVGCGSGYGGGGGVHYDNVTAVYSGDSTYSGSTSAPLQITIQ